MSTYPKIGDQFGVFLITGEVGRGGMGVVFSAQQQPLNRPVALKVLDPRFSGDPDFVARFTREGELLAKLNSPHVIQVFDHGQIDGCLYLAMQEIRGGDLADYLRRNGPLPPALAADLTAQVASALADAHALGVIHRDIKPSNVLLAMTGQDLFAYLCDFGIAQTAQPGVTQVGTVPGSLAFTAPERHEGRPADARSDLYSLGCLLWCLLCGTNPYAGTDFQIAQQHFSAPVPQVGGSGPVEIAINQVLARLLAKDPSHRPASAVEAVTALRGLQRLAEATGSVSQGQRTDPPDQHTRVAARPLPGPVPVAPPGSYASPTTVGGAAIPRLGHEVPTLPPPAVSPPKGKPATVPRTTLVAVAIALATALIGGGSLWALSTVFSSEPRSSAVGSPAAPTVTPEEGGAPSSAVEPTRDVVQILSQEIDVGTNPHGIVVNPGSRLAFVANYDDSSVSVVNVDSNTVVRKIEVGKQPQSLAVDPASGLLLVGCDGVPAVQLYDLQGYRLVGSVSTGKGPIRITTHPAQKVAYAVAQGSSTMGVISLSSHKLIRTIDVGSKPRVIAVDERDQIAYIGHWDSSTMSVIDLNSQSKIADLEVGRDPNAIAIATEARLAFVGNYGKGKGGGGSATVIDLDTRAVRKTIKVDAGPSRLAVDEDAGAVYLTCLYAGSIDVIDVSTLTVTDRFRTAKRPVGAAVDPTTGKLYVTSFDKHVVQVFEA